MKVLSPVSFAHGLLGTVAQGGHFSLRRTCIAPMFWKTDHISVHIQARILMLKSLAKNQDVSRTQIKLLPHSPTLAEAARMTQLSAWKE